MHRASLVASAVSVALGSASFGLYVGCKYGDKLEVVAEGLLRRNAAAKLPTAVSEDGLMTKAVEIAGASGKLAVLSTMSKDEGVSMRVIQPLPLAIDISSSSKSPRIFFHTNSQSRKASELNASSSNSSASNCTLLYLDAKTLSYSCFQGTAHKLGAAEHRKHWQSHLRAFYPDGPDGKSFVVYELIPSRVEVVSITENLVSRHDSWKPPTLIKNPDGSGWRRTD